MQSITYNRKTDVRCWLTVLYVGCLMISNIITNKQITLPFGLQATAGVMVFPITYILSDIFSEVYGYRWSRSTSYMAFGMNIFMSLVFYLTLRAKAPAYWQNQAAYQTVLGAVPRVLIASLLAFMVGDLVNDLVFKRMKEQGGRFGWRAIVSSVCGELVDSAIFIPIVFVGSMSAGEMAKTAATEVSIKVAYELVVLPITTWLVGVMTTTEGDVA